MFYLSVEIGEWPRQWMHVVVIDERQYHVVVVAVDQYWYDHHYHHPHCRTLLVVGSVRLVVMWSEYQPGSK